MKIRGLSIKTEHQHTHILSIMFSVHTFGIYTDKDKAEAAKKVVIKQLYEKEKDNEWSYVDDISDIKVSVVEIESDMAVDIELGGYCE